MSTFYEKIKDVYTEDSTKVDRNNKLTIEHLKYLYLLWINRKNRGIENMKWISPSIEKYK